MPKRASGAEVLLIPQEVAEQLRYTHLKVLEMRAAGEFPNAVNLGTNGKGNRWRIPQSDVDRFIESRRLGAGAA